MSEQNEWNEKQEFPSDPTEYVKTRVLMLAAVFNRKASDELVSVFTEVLRGYPLPALKGGFGKAESTLERFPTPKQLRELCNEEMPSNMWRYHYAPSTAIDPEGRQIQVLLDPETKEKLYRPQDCIEGRMFLDKLRELGTARRDSREPGQEG